MTTQHFLKIDSSPFDLEQTTIYGIFEEYGEMSWHIEIYPPEEENYIMFNALILDGVISPAKLDGLIYEADTSTTDMYEHTVFVGGEDRFLKSVNLKFGKWDTENQSIRLNGSGIIADDEGLPEIPYSFDIHLNFTGINLFETTHEDAHAFVDKYFPLLKNELELKFEEVPSGLSALIEGKF